MKKRIPGSFPNADQLEKELKRVRYNQRYNSVLKSTV